MGFGKNLCLWLRERDDVEVLRFTRANDVTELSASEVCRFNFSSGRCQSAQDPVNLSPVMQI